MRVSVYWPHSGSGFRVKKFVFKLNLPADLHSGQDGPRVMVERFKVCDPHSCETTREAVKDGHSLEIPPREEVECVEEVGQGDGLSLPRSRKRTVGCVECGHRIRHHIIRHDAVENVIDVANEKSGVHFDALPSVRVTESVFALPPPHENGSEAANPNGRHPK